MRWATGMSFTQLPSYKYDLPGPQFTDDLIAEQRKTYLSHTPRRRLLMRDGRGRLMIVYGRVWVCLTDDHLFIFEPGTHEESDRVLTINMKGQNR